MDAMLKAISVLPPSLEILISFIYVFSQMNMYLCKKPILYLLWVAEGFIPQQGQRILENMAEGYLNQS